MNVEWGDKDAQMLTVSASGKVCAGHKYVGHKYVGHKYVGHKYVGHRRLGTTLHVSDRCSGVANWP